MPVNQTPEELWSEWLQHPITKQFRTWAAWKRHELQEQWAEGNFSDVFDSAMLVKNAGATGACSVYRQIQDLNFDVIRQELDDAEHFRIDSLGQGSAGGALGQ